MHLNLVDAAMIAVGLLAASFIRLAIVLVTLRVAGSKRAKTAEAKTQNVKDRVKEVIGEHT